MAITYDDKGKYFTEVVSKVGIMATVQTVTQRIEGLIHVRLNERISDELERDDAFLPVTAAKIFDANGRLQDECEFMSVRRSQIVWIVPRVEHRTTGAGS
jgi:hypothetical protein